ncbi:unnamed protein product, partial [Prorocentrum cordatum]
RPWPTAHRQNTVPLAPREDVWALPPSTSDHSPRRIARTPFRSRRARMSGPPPPRPRHPRPARGRPSPQRVAGPSQERLAAMEQSISGLQEGLRPKLEAAQVYSRDDTDRMLKDFYCKGEMDAQISRIWWRLGEGKTSLSQRAMAR